MTDHISICVCTLRRKQMLERLLRSLRFQETDGRFDFSVVVVDNDREGSARENVERLKADLGLDITYDIEPEQTIPAARNRALALSRGNLIAIIDDDEFAPLNWLLMLHLAIKAYDADGVLGPVYPFFSSQPPKWLIKGRFCERPVIGTGTLLDWTQTRTGNVLLKRDVFEKNRIRFDLKWKTSGSDRAFFKEAMAAGCRFIAVKEAPVYETVPPERWRKSYYLRRSLVQGFNTYRNSAAALRGLARVIVPLKRLAATGAYIIALPFAACLGRHMVVKCLEGGGHHLSWLLAMLGIELVKKRDF